MRFRYSRWDGTQDPLGPDLAAGDLLEAISEDVLAGADPEEALERLRRHGMSGRFSGLDALRARLRAAREAELARLNLAGPLEEVARRLEEILERERSTLAFRAELLRLGGRRTAALELLREALDACRRTGMAFVGPIVLGGIAATTDDADERRAALAEGHEVLARGSASHTHLLFARDAIEGCLTAGELDAALAAAHALEAYTAAEPVAWARFWIDRARTLVAAARGAEPGLVAAELVRLRAEALRIGFLREAGALEERLARLASAGEARSAPSREIP